MNNNSDIDKMIVDLQVLKDTPVEECVSNFKFQGVVAKVFNALVATHPNRDKDVVINQCILATAYTALVENDNISNFLKYFGDSQNTKGMQVVHLYNDIINECREILNYRSSGVSNSTQEN